MDKTIVKTDDFTLKISGTTPYEQTVTKDQLIDSIKQIESNIGGFQSRIKELEENKLEVQALLDEAIAQGCLTRDEYQDLHPVVVTPQNVEITK